MEGTVRRVELNRSASPSLPGLPCLPGFIIYYSTPPPPPMQPLGHHCSAATPLTGARTCLARLARLLRAHPSLSTCEFRCPRLLSEASPDDRDSHSALPAGAFNCLNHWIVVIVELASAVVWTIRPVRTRPTSQPYLHPEQTEVDLPCTGGDSLGTARAGEVNRSSQGQVCPPF